MKPYLVTTQRTARFEARPGAPLIERMRTALPRPAPKRPVAHLRQPLRIGYVLDRFPRGSHGFVLQEILELESRGVQVHIFSLGGPDGRIDDTASALSRLQSPVHYFLGDVPARDAATAGDATSEAARWIANIIGARGLEHLHAHGASVAADVTRAASRLTGLGYSFTAHADALNDAADGRLLREKIEGARFAVALRNFDRGRLLQICGHDVAGKVYRISMGINPEECEFADSDAHDSDSVLAVGPLVENSGFTDLIEAFGMLRDRGRAARLTIIGEGPYEATLRAQIDTRRLASRVHLMGGVSRSELTTLMRMHTAMAIPWVADDHDRDVLANLVLEAMAIGLPVLSTDLPGIRELIDDGMSGRVIRPNDPRWLAGALETLFESPEVRDGLARQARSTVERRFDASRNVSHLVQLFFDVVARKRLAT